MALLCRTVSNALLKSNEGDDNDVWVVLQRLCHTHTVQERDQCSSIVEPLGRKAYWSVKHRVAGGLSRARYRKSRTMIFSVMRDRTEVTDLGLKLLGSFGLDIFGTGQILARFHCVGTIDAD